MVEISSVGIQKYTRDIPKSGSKLECLLAEVAIFMAVSRLESLISQWHYYSVPFQLFRQLNGTSAISCLSYIKKLLLIPKKVDAAIHSLVAKYIFVWYALSSLSNTAIVMK